MYKYNANRRLAFLVNKQVFLLNNLIISIVGLSSGELSSLDHNMIIQSCFYTVTTYNNQQIKNRSFKNEIS